MFFRILLILFCLVNSLANALKIEINRGVVKPDPIAIAFYGDKGQEVEEIVKSDLLLSGLFEPIPEEAFIEDKNQLEKNGANLKNWQVLNIRFLLYGKAFRESNKIFANFELLDVVTGQTMLSLKVDGTETQLRKVAHSIADFAYERITNEQGYFNTNIVYVETSYNKVSSKRKTRLVKIDQDGFNPRNLTDGSELVLTPRFSPDGKTIAYISYSDKAKDVLGKSAHVYIMNANLGTKQLMINKKIMRLLIQKNHGNPVQMTYAPRFSPDGQKAVLAIIIDGKSAIYVIDLTTNELKQLTEHKCIDTSPCFSNDGKQIVFTSNRDGREAIFVMDADGSNQKRISQGEGKYSQPIWSPRGDLIAFSKQRGREFYLGIIKPDGSGERLINSGYLVEAPCWSSNGRYLVFSMQPSSKQKVGIAVVDITGHHSRVIETRKDAAYPAWSPTIDVKK